MDCKKGSPASGPPARDPNNTSHRLQVLLYDPMLLSRCPGPRRSIVGQFHCGSRTGWKSANSPRIFCAKEIPVHGIAVGRDSSQCRPFAVDSATHPKMERETKKAKLRTQQDFLIWLIGHEPWRALCYTSLLEILGSGPDTTATSEDILPVGAVRFARGRSCKERRRQRREKLPYCSTPVTSQLAREFSPTRPILTLENCC